MNHNYKKLINEFCDYKGYPPAKRNKLLRDEIVQADLYEADADKIRELIVGQLKASKYTTIKDYVSVLDQFFNWSRERRGIAVNSPFGSDLLQVRELTYYAVKQNPLPVVTDERLETYIARLTENRLYYEVLLRAFYEGISSEEIVRLWRTDVQLSECCILTSKGMLFISERFAGALKKYFEEFDEYVSNGRKYPVKPLFPGAFIIDGVRDSEREIPEAERLSFYNVKSTQILTKIVSKQIGVRLSKKDLLYNGFISLVERHLDGDHDQTARIFIDESKAKARTSILAECARQFQFTEKIGQIRLNCYPYVLSRYQ